MNLRQFAVASFAMLLALGVSNNNLCAAERTIDAAVDMTQMARHLLTSKISIPVESGDVELWYPKWIPGIHGPGEQIRNIGGFRVKTEAGKSLSWRRDENDLYKVHVTVPTGVDRINVELTYIVNQPTRVSKGVDSYGNAHLLAVNFNTCLVYPHGWGAVEARVNLSVKLPTGWKFGTSLKQRDSSDDWTTFETETLETVIDSPLIAGKNYRKLEITRENQPDVRMHFVSESNDALNFDEQHAEKYRRLAAESFELFGSAPFESYDFLVVCSDSVPKMGLEHLSSSLNGIDEQALVHDEKQKGWSAYLLPHEFVHAWCGKYRRPAGMYRNNFHTTKQTKLLWIYEGLTQYLGNVLTIRSGLIEYESFCERMGATVGYLANRRGRNWRSLEDTAIAAHTLRGGSNSWSDLRRNQDYYDEGALFWLEADAIIREQTDGKKSLDDFCRTFFASPGGRQNIKPYELDEVIDILNQQTKFDWKGLVDRRIFLPHDELSLEVLSRCGYELTFQSEKPSYLKTREKERKYVSETYSLGIAFDESDAIQTITPDGPADRAGLTEDMEVLGVNHKKFTKDRFAAALKQTPATAKIDFLVLDGETFRTISVHYKGGPRYPVITPNAGQRDWLKEICKARGK